MGLDYWLVHIKWTIPPSIVLSVLYWPFFTKSEICKICTLIVIAVTATVPWDSYLIRHGVWSYPIESVLGTTLFAIPLEELFFFVIQTYVTSLLYIMLTKRLVLPTHLLPRTSWTISGLGTLILSILFAFGVKYIWKGGKHTYMGLILLWVCPFMMLTWILCSRFLLALPRIEVLTSICLPSMYLCLVDKLALQRGTWVIERGTKLDIQVWGALEIEEAIFFFATNIMVVFGHVAIDHAIALAEYRTRASTGGSRPVPAFGRVVYQYFSESRNPDQEQLLRGIQKAVQVVSQKSQSMYMGSAMFQEALRTDLLLLYYFCRTMDDLVDEATDRRQAEQAIQQCYRALRIKFSGPDCKQKYTSADDQNACPERVCDEISANIIFCVNMLPSSRLTIEPLLALLTGFKTDLDFADPCKDTDKESFPIKTEEDLETYAYNVAGTVATSILELVFQHYHMASTTTLQERNRLKAIGASMGQTLQYVNIARDIGRDAAIGRVYLPTSWLEQEGLSPKYALCNLDDPAVARLRLKMLDKADEGYRTSIRAISELPLEVRGPLRTVVDSYTAIGKIIRKNPQQMRVGEKKMKLSIVRRLAVAWRAMLHS